MKKDKYTKHFENMLKHRQETIMRGNAKSTVAIPKPKLGNLFLNADSEGSLTDEEEQKKPKKKEVQITI